MSYLLLLTHRSVKLVLGVGLLTSACSRDEMTPDGTISGVIPPVVGVGSATSVTATALDGTAYTATPNVQTGAFTLPLPAGTYTLTFITTLSAPDTFPVRVPVTVAAGATTTPILPPLTHDNVTRGLLRWMTDGTTYTATRLRGKFSDQGLFSDSKGCFYLSGTAGEFDKSPEVAEVFLVVPEASRKGVIFVGPATYTLGGEEIGSYGQFTYYAGGSIAGFSRYDTPMYPGTPTGSLRLTHYDANQGVAAGTFEFVAAASANATGQRTITNGEFNVTF
jgi:hypothetical protein